LLDRAAKGLNDVQSLAIESLINFLKRNYISKRTVEIMKTIIQTFHAAPNFQNRIVFIEIYNKMAERFSRKFFKAHNLNELVIKLGDDKVPIIRKKVFENVVTIRRMLNQNDTVLIVKLDDTLNRARLDKNKTVSEVNFTRDFLIRELGWKRGIERVKILNTIFLRRI